MSLVSLQSRLQVLVAASPLLTDRSVLIEDKNNLVSMVETALANASLCVVVAPESGEVKAGAARGRAGWIESFDIAIHRGLADDDTTPSTVAVLDDLRARIHGAPVQESGPSLLFECRRHELRENGDGTYVRVLTVAVADPLSP